MPASSAGTEMPYNPRAGSRFPHRRHLPRRHCPRRGSRKSTVAELYFLVYRQPADEDEGGTPMLMRTDPFREFDRLAQQVFGTAARPAVMPMDAYRDGETFVAHFDLPGVRTESIDLQV